MLPLVLHSLGAPLGEPFADDFDYLRRTLLEGGGAFFDGHGSILYWRPFGRQLYFGLFSSLIVTRPGLVAAFHVAALAATALLLYRALRARWPGPWAFAAASFTLLAESTRMLAAWPSHFMDLGALLCAAVALHEAARRRPATAILAMVASLLFKEVGLLAALLVPWLPAPGAAAPEPAGASRWRRAIAVHRRALTWTTVAAAAVGAWGLAYLLVSRHAGLFLPHQFEPNAEAWPWIARLGWAAWSSVRSQFSLEAAYGRWDGGIGIAAAAILAIAVARIATRPEARARARAALPWMLWGAAWFLAGVAPLTEVFPAWAPYRSAFGGIGLGVALVALVAPAGTGLLAALVALRLATFALSPGPPSLVTAVPQESGAAFDFPKLVRLERFARETRLLLQGRTPALPRGALVGQHHMPQMTGYALSGDLALQVWTRDTTARQVRWEDFRRDPGLPLATIVEYQPHRAPQFALVDPDAARALFRALERIGRAEWDAALAELDRADALQRDGHAAVFLATVGSKRAWIRSVLGDSAGARREAERAYALWPDNPDSRFLFAERSFREGRLAEAAALLDTLLDLDPNDAGGHALSDSVAAARARDGP